MERWDPKADAADARRAQAGDTEAFAALVGRYARRVHDLARRMLGDATKAEDISQQAFLNAWRALERFDPERPFRNWLLRIVTNLCRNEFQRHRRSREIRPAGGEADPPQVAVDPPVPGDRDATSRVREAVASLPESHRMAVTLHYFHGMALADVAEVTGVPVATLKTHLFRGRARLRALLEAPETTPPSGGTAP